MKFKIKEARIKAGLSQKDLAKIIGVAPSTFNGYESGNHDPKSDLLKKIAEACDVTVDYLLCHEPKDNIDSLDAVQAAQGDLSNAERSHIKKYRSLDPYGKEAVDGVLDVEWRRCTQLSPEVAQDQDAVYFICPGFLSTMSAGTGQEAGNEYPENYRLIKEPPRGTSYIASISGDSMEPTYHDGDKLFIHACTSIRVGQIGVFFMAGQQWVKELGDGVLISHNSDPKYAPRPFTEDVRCQGLVLGVCDDSYFK